MPLKLRRRVRAALGLKAPTPRTDRGLLDALAREPDAWQAARDSARGGPRVLVATSVGGFTPGTAIEGLLAVALTLRGAEVELLLCDEVLPACLHATRDGLASPAGYAHRGPQQELCRGCRTAGFAAYEALGLRLHRFSDVLDAADRDVAAGIAADTPADRLGDAEWEGLPVGEHALAGALRYFARGTLPEGPEALAVGRRYLAAAILTGMATRRLLGSSRPECAVFHHGIYVPPGVIGAECRRQDVRVVNWHVAYRKRRFLFSHRESYHHTLIDEPTSAWDGLDLTPELDEELLGYLRSRWQGRRDWIGFHEDPQEDAAEVARAIGFDPSRPCIGLLTNVMWDARLHFRANAFPDMLDWAVRTVEYFAGRPELQLVIRVHPAEIRGTVPSRQPFVPELRRRFPRLPDNVFVIPPESRVSTYAAMLQCDSVLVYGTKMGVELTALGLPVIVAGEAWIKNKGVTLDASSPEEYMALLDRLPLGRRLDEATTRRARQYAYHFFFRRMIPLDCVEPAEGFPPFRHRVPGVDALRPDRSRGLDVVCDGILAGSPFVYPAEVAGERFE